MTFLF